MGNVLRIQSKLSRALHARCAKKLVQNNDKGSEGRENGCHAICGIPAGLERRHNGGLPREGDLMQEPGIAWRSGTSWWDVPW